jgi:uncharacterized membrane protein
MLVAADAGAYAISIHEIGNHVTEATVTVDATPAEIYALVTDYSHWSQILGDVRSVKVERGTREHARVRFRSNVLDQVVTVQFDNEPNRAIRFVGVKGPPGGRASGSYVLEPIDGGRRTRVVASLYLDVVGIPSVFVGDAKLRAMREAKLRSDMRDVMSHLERPT